MEIQQSVLNEWYCAVRVANEHFNNCLVNDFKVKYPLEYRYISSFFRLRTELKKDVEVLSCLGNVQWFTLTFNEDKDKNKETTKRREAFDFLNELFVAFVLVEEHGEDKGRYHIHGFGVYHCNKSFLDFISWHSGQNIKTLFGVEDMDKKVKYLTKYAVKQLPRIRRSKSLCKAKRTYKHIRPFKGSYQSCYNCKVNLMRLRMFGLELCESVL